jgi:hypothetical protein
MSKSGVSGLTLASGVTSVLVLALLPWVNWKNHLRVGSDYESLYQETLALRNGHGAVDEERFADLRGRFRDLTEEARKAEALLRDRQVNRYENRTIRELPRILGRPIPSSWISLFAIPSDDLI